MNYSEMVFKFLFLHMIICWQNILRQEKRKYLSCFHSFKREKGVVEYSSASKFGELKNNLIIDSFNTLLDEIYDLGE